MLSPPYDCQLVLVMKLIAVLKARWRQVSHAGRIPREMGLPPQDEIEQREAAETEHQHRCRILLPAHFCAGSVPSMRYTSRSKAPSQRILPSYTRAIYAERFHER